MNPFGVGLVGSFGRPDLVHGSRSWFSAREFIAALSTLSSAGRLVPMAIAVSLDRNGLRRSRGRSLRVLLFGCWTIPSLTIPVQDEAAKLRRGMKTSSFSDRRMVTSWKVVALLALSPMVAGTVGALVG